MAWGHGSDIGPNGSSPVGATPGTGGGGGGIPRFAMPLPSSVESPVIPRISPVRLPGQNNISPFRPSPGDIAPPGGGVAPRPGSAGSAGSSGSAGSAGSAGSSGSTGSAGSAGSSGSAGSAGSAGSSGGSVASPIPGIRYPGFPSSGPSGSAAGSSAGSAANPIGSPLDPRSGARSGGAGGAGGAGGTGGTGSHYPATTAGNWDILYSYTPLGGNYHFGATGYAGTTFEFRGTSGSAASLWKADPGAAPVDIYPYFSGDRDWVNIVTTTFTPSDPGVLPVPDAPPYDPTAPARAPTPTTYPPLYPAPEPTQPESSPATPPEFPLPTPLPKIPLPNPDRPELPTTTPGKAPAPAPDPGRPDFPIPSPYPIPIPSPTTTPQPGPGTGSKPKQDPKIGGFPVPTVSIPSPTTTPTQEPATQSDQCSEAVDLLKKIKKKTEECSDPCLESITVQVFDGCDGNTPKKKNKSIQVIAGTGDLYAGIFSELLAQQSLQCDNHDCVAAVPEWWQVRVGANRPQLIMQFAERLPNGNYGPPHWVLSIPWCTVTSSHTTPPISSYQKGNVEVCLRLADNSSIVANCINEATAIRVLSQAIACISPTQLIGANHRIGVRSGEGLQNLIVYPRSAKYFSTGQRNTVPDWVVRYD